MHSQDRSGLSAFALARWTLAAVLCMCVPAAIVQAGPPNAQPKLVIDSFVGSRNGEHQWLASFDGQLAFGTRFESTGWGMGSVWLTDGSSSGTRRIAGTRLNYITQTGFFYEDHQPVQLGDLLLFDGGRNSNSPQPQPWRSDGQQLNTMALTPVTNAFEIPTPLLYTVFGNKVYFIGQDQPTSRVWETDGTIAGTFPLTPRTSIIDLGRSGSALWWTQTRSDSSSALIVELFRSDGTAAGTQLVKAVPGRFPRFSRPRAGRTVSTDEFFYFQVTDVTTQQLWRSDGTEEGTIMLLGGIDDLSMQKLVRVGNQVLFQAKVSNAGSFLYRTDGTVEGTRPVGQRGGVPGQFASASQAIYAVGSRAFFSSSTYVPNLPGSLWTSDGTDAGTYQVADINPSGDDQIFSFAAGPRGKVYFQANDGVHGDELWEVDTTIEPMPVRMVADLSPGPLYSSPSLLTLVNNRLFFLAGDPVHGRELHVLDLCLGDFNNNGEVSVQDVLEYIGAFIAGRDKADVNGVPGVTVDDLLSYLDGFFAGCS